MDLREKHGGSGLPPVVGPLPYEVATDMVSFGTGSAAISAPIFSVSNISGQQQILILVPCEVTPGTVPVTVTVNGGSQTLNVNVLPASPGIFQTTMSDGVVRAVIERPDGSFVSPSNPARRGCCGSAGSHIPRPPQRRRCPSGE